MADVKATKTGNWSDTTVWSTGALPGATDTAYLNGFNVAADQNITVALITNAAGGTVTAAAGGNLTVAGARTINANITGGVNSGTLGAVTTNNGASTTVTINGNVNGGAGFNNYGLYHASTGTVAITGAVTGGAASGAYGVQNASTGAVTVSGNVWGGAGGHGIANAVAGTINVTGDCTGGSAASIYGILNTGAGSVTVTGTVRGAPDATNSNSAAGIYNSTTGSVTVNGNAVTTTPTGTTQQYAIYGAGAGNITINGNVAPVGSSNSSCVLVSGGALTVTGTVTGGTTNNTGGITATGNANATIGGVVSAGSGSQNLGIAWNSSGTLTINNNVLGVLSNGVQINAASPVNIIGNVTGGASAAVLCNTNGITLNVTGNVTGGASANGHGIQAQALGSVTVTGNVTGGQAAGAAHGISLSAAATVSVYGTVMPSANGVSMGMNVTAAGTVFAQLAKSNDYPNNSSTAPAPAIATGNNTVTVDALECGSGGCFPITGRYFVRAAGTNYFKGYQSNAGTPFTMGEITDYPIPANVRNAVSYATGTYTGTLKVPPAASVAVGVPVDNTVGTATLDPTALLGATLRTRLATCATVQSTGEQLAAFGP